MQISIQKSEIEGSVSAPSSKSYTIRALMCAALAAGQSELQHPLSSDDTEAALRVLGQIGVRSSLGAESWKITGGQFRTPVEDLFCSDSAATLRFMSAICALVPGRSRLTAGASLARRPVRALVEALRRWGIDILSLGDVAPITVHGGRFKGGITELPGNISSQYVSALLLIAPRAEKGATIWLTAPLESRAYVLMTIESLKQFGIHVRYSDEMMEYEVAPQSYQPVRCRVEGDWSSASYLLGLGAVAGETRIKNLNYLSLQGDKVILDYLQEMGAQVTISGDLITVRKDRLRAIKADLNESIDLLPTMAVLAALAEGTSEFTGIQRARLKESNRVASVRQELQRAGIRVEEEQDKLTISGGKLQEAVIDSHDDHRIAMAFSLLGVAAGGITIRNAECVSKTYPEYWQTLRNLGVKIDEQ